jgi:hypothetical protein
MSSSDGASASRVARDERGERTAFDDIVIGQDLGTLEWEVTPDAVDKQCDMDADHDPLFEGSDAVAPPQITYRPPRWLFSRMFNVRGVFYRWEMENIAPIRPNTKITVSGKIIGKWIKADREFVEFEAIGTNEEGKLVFRTRRVHVLDVLKRTTPREGVGVDSGKKPERI